MKTIETKVSANGAVNVYVDGKRTSNEKAVQIARANGLPTYNANCHTYADNYINKTFATPVAAYRWLLTKANSNINFADGSWEIEENHTVIYEHAGDELKVANAELEAYILTLDNGDAESIKAQIAEFAKVVKAESLKLDPEYQRQQAELAKARAEREAAEAQAKAIWKKSRHLAEKIAVESKPVEATFRLAIYNFFGAKVQYALAESYDDNDETVIDGYDETAFDALPTVDELNDVDTDETDEAKAEAARKFADKLFRVERFSQKQVDTVVAAILDGQNADAVKKLIDDFKTANFNEAQKVAQRIEEIVAAETVTDDSKLGELFQAREEKRIAARHASFDSDESKAARAANRDVEEFIAKVAKDLRTIAPAGLNVVESGDSADLDAPKFVVIELATDKRTSYSTIAETKAALTNVNEKATVTDNTVADETPAETDGYDETKMTTIETKMTVSELKEALKASRNKVRLHFTAKGNPSWQSVYRYGKKDHEIGYCRISKREANERLAEFGLTANLVIEIGKAKAEVEAAQHRHLCIDQMGAVLAKFAKAENETVNSDGITETNNDADVGFTGEDFLNELTVTLDINVAVKKILATADNFRFLDQRHEISLTKPDSEIMWERDFRGYKGDRSFLITEVYNHPDGTLREVYLCRDGYLCGDGLPVTVEIAEPNRNMKLAAKIVDGLNGTLEFLGGGFTKNGKPTVCFDVTNGSEISPMIRVTEAFTDETKSNLDYVEVTRDYAETKTEKRTRYYFATGNVDIDALTDLNGRCNDILKRRHNLNANMRLLTNDEYAGKLAELDSEIRYVEVQIAAVKAGDTFDYVDAAEHIKGVCEDIKTCIDLWTHEHGLTVEQCEQIYVAAHIDRNFDTAVDCKLVDAMISYFKQANKLTAKLRDVTETASYQDVTCQDGATILAHFKGAKVTVDGGGCDILTAWDRLLGHYDTPAQVTAVINRIKACIDGNVGSFTFPTVEELKDKPAYDEKHWAVDFDIYHADSDLTDAELQTYTGLLRTAMTANGNRACVELEDSVITVYGDADGDNDTVDKIVDEMTDSGCWGEYPEDNEDSTPDESTPETKESLREEKYALWDERRAIDGEIIGVKNAISELKDGMRWLRDAGICDAQIDELDYIIVKLEYRLGILSDKRNAISAKIDDCNEKARLC